MKINSTAGIDEAWRKVTKESESREIGFTGEGSLYFTGKTPVLFSEFLLIMGENLYMGHGPLRYSRADIPEAGIKVGFFSLKKLLVYEGVETAEWITSKKKASLDFRFLLAAACPGAIILMVADRNGFHQGRIGASGFEATWSAVLALATAWMPKDEKMIRNFYCEEVSQDGQET